MFETFTDPTLPIEERAKEFATAWHGSINQVRQYTGEPYITHPAAVVEIVRSVTNDPVMLAAAWMHGVLERTFSSTRDAIAFRVFFMDFQRLLVIPKVPY